jgi:hypothetical protein
MARIMVKVPKVWLATGLLSATATIAVGQEPKTTALESDVLVERAKCAEVCKEYVPGSKICKVTIDMRTQSGTSDSRAMSNCDSKPEPIPWRRAHWDVTVDPAKPAWVYLIDKSPLLSCSLTTSPTALQRDSSAAFGSMLTSLAALGAPPAFMGPSASFLELQLKTVSLSHDDRKTLQDELKKLNTITQTGHQTFEAMLKRGQELQNKIARQVVASTADASAKAKEAGDAADKSKAAAQRAKEAADGAQNAADEARKVSGNAADRRMAAEKAKQASDAAAIAKKDADKADAKQKDAKAAFDKADQTKQLLADAGKTLSADVGALIAKLEQLHQRVDNAERAAGKYGELPSAYTQARKLLLEHWRYDYENNGDAQTRIDRVWAAVKAALEMQIEAPDAAQFVKDLDGIRADVTALGARFRVIEQAYAQTEIATQGREWNSDFREWRNGDLERTNNGAIVFLAEGIKSASSNLPYLQAAQDLLKKVYSALLNVVDDKGTLLAKYPTEQALAFGPFTQKQANVTITCKDIATDKQPFDAVQFVAYFEKPPKWDFSVGALVSTLPGREVGTVPGPIQSANSPLCPADSSGNVPPCAPTTLAVTSSSNVQFMPMAFLEFHPWNRRCPWAHEGGGAHSRVYVCSLGPAFGFTANPNSGSPTAEFFEGFSLGIQRVSLLFGVHNGRSQEFSGGYSVGQTLPPGVSVTPPTTLQWKTAFAFGISYRIPLR